MGIKRLFHWSSNVIIGEGSSISFWYDSRNGSPILSQLDLTPRPPHFKISLREAVHRDLHLTTTHAGVTVNAEVTFNDDSDRIIWKWGSGGKYSSKSVFEVMIRGGKEVWLFPEVWCCKAPLKARVFAYLLLLEKVLTHEVMISRNMHCDPSCVQCDLEVSESAYHLFFECPYAVQVWQEIHRHLGVVKLIRRGVVRDTWKASWEYTRATKTLTIKSWATYFICVCWGIWKQRNNRIFRDSALNPRIVAESVVQEGLLWLRNCQVHETGLGCSNRMAPGHMRCMNADTYVFISV